MLLPAERRAAAARARGDADGDADADAAAIAAAAAGDDDADDAAGGNGNGAGAGGLGAAIGALWRDYLEEPFQLRERLEPIFAQGLLGLDPEWCLWKVELPALALLILVEAGPPVVARATCALAGLAPETERLAVQLSHAAFALVVVVALALAHARKAAVHLHNAIRDDRYLVGRNLRDFNHEDETPETRQQQQIEAAAAFVGGGGGAAADAAVAAVGGAAAAGGSSGAGGGSSWVGGSHEKVE